VLADTTLEPFFTAAVARDGGARLVTCLQRQISGDIAGGPDVYGNANALVDSALDTDDNGALAATEQCQTMLAAHTGLGITDAQFEALDLHAATALTLALSDPADGTKARTIINAVTAALTGAGICADIVENAGEAAQCAQFDPNTDPDAP